MSNNVGTLITSPIRPQSDADSFPTAHANEILGGLKSFQSVSQRDALPNERRQEGMLASISGITYVLESGISNSSWRDILLGDQQLIKIADAASYKEFTTISSTSEGFPLVSNVTWPGGMTGVLTMTEDSVWEGSVASYYVTYGPKVLIQPSVTRSSVDGRVTFKPQIIISDEPPPTTSFHYLTPDGGSYLTPDGGFILTPQ